MYQALYRKWRPTVFEDVLGQSHITDTLKNQILFHKLSHAYLFSGSRGTGKTSTAKILSRAVNCENPINGNPCNECHACRTALNGSAVDIIEIDAASNNRVDDVRIIRDEVVYTPADLRYKVYIIDEAHMLTNQAFNALLKTLEEPPAHVIFVFATTEPHKFPTTILSRCQRFDFKRITPFDTEKRIRQITGQDGYTISDEAIGLLARIADGSMRDALSILDQCLSAGITNIDFSDIARIAGTSDPNFIYDFSQHIIDGNLQASFTAIKTAYENGRDMERILEDLIAHFRGVLVTKTLEGQEAAAEVLMTTKNALQVYSRQAQELSEERLLRYLDALSEAISSQKYLHNPRLCVEVAVTAMVKRPSLTDTKGIIERLQEVELQLTRLKSQGIPVSKEPAVASAVSTPIPEPVAKAEMQIPVSVEPQQADEFVSDFPTEEYIPPEPPVAEPEILPEPAAEEETTVFDETDVSATSVKPEPSSPGSLAPVWEQVLETAKKYADFGFIRIVSDCKLEETEGGVELSFQKESFLNIAKMNQYDSILSKAILEVTGKDLRVKFRSAEENTPEGDSFRQLMSKLDGYQGKITFK